MPESKLKEMGRKLLDHVFHLLEKSGIGRTRLASRIFACLVNTPLVRLASKIPGGFLMLIYLGHVFGCKITTEVRGQKMVAIIEGRLPLLLLGGIRSACYLLFTFSSQKKV